MMFYKNSVSEGIKEMVALRRWLSIHTIKNKRLTFEVSQVLFRIQYLQRSHCGHITICPPISGSHTSLLKGFRTHNTSSRRETYTNETKIYRNVNNTDKKRKEIFKFKIYLEAVVCKFSPDIVLKLDTPSSNPAVCRTRFWLSSVNFRWSFLEIKSFLRQQMLL